MGKKVKVVFDTNVWLSIFMQKILTDEFSQAKQKLTIYVSKEILLELSKTLLYPRVVHVLSEIGMDKKRVLKSIEANSIMVESNLKLQSVAADAEDNKILECALACRADFVVSGDKHLLQVGKFKKTKILSPREFFDSITRN